MSVVGQGLVERLGDVGRDGLAMEDRCCRKGVRGGGRFY